MFRPLASALAKANRYPMIGTLLLLPLFMPIGAGIDPMGDLIDEAAEEYRTADAAYKQHKDRPEVQAALQKHDNGEELFEQDRVLINQNKSLQRRRDEAAIRHNQLARTQVIASDRNGNLSSWDKFVPEPLPLADQPIMYTDDAGTRRAGRTTTEWRDSLKAPDAQFQRIQHAVGDPADRAKGKPEDVQRCFESILEWAKQGMQDLRRTNKRIHMVAEGSWEAVDQFESTPILDDEKEQRHWAACIKNAQKRRMSKPNTDNKHGHSGRPKAQPGQWQRAVVDGFHSMPCNQPAWGPQQGWGPVGMGGGLVQMAPLAPGPMGMHPAVGAGFDPIGAAGMGVPNGKSGANKGGPKATDVCHNCGGKGHWAMHCPMPKK